jgi:hypothetical protein
VDKKDFQDAVFIFCPLPRCKNVWCKHCSQTVDTSGPKHSCDGVNELKHLMDQKGWKYCPGCKTPTEKSSGCNHMTVSVFLENNLIKSIYIYSARRLDATREYINVRVPSFELTRDLKTLLLQMRGADCPVHRQ